MSMGQWLYGSHGHDSLPDIYFTFNLQILESLYPPVPLPDLCLASCDWTMCLTALEVTIDASFTNAMVAFWVDFEANVWIRFLGGVAGRADLFGCIEGLVISSSIKVEGRLTSCWCAIIHRYAIGLGSQGFSRHCDDCPSI